MEGKIIIEADIPEKEFMESCLNMRFSGYNPMIPLGFYALAHSWHVNKLIYYLNLLEVKR